MNTSSEHLSRFQLSTMGSEALRSPQTSPVYAHSKKEPMTPHREPTSTPFFQLDPFSRGFQPFGTDVDSIELGRLNLSDEKWNESLAFGGGSISFQSHATNEKYGVPGLQGGLDTPASDASYLPLTPITLDQDEVHSNSDTMYSPLASTSSHHKLKSRSFEERLRVKTKESEIVGRYLLIENVPKTVSENQITSVIRSIATVQAIICNYLNSRGRVLVTFYDPREAEKLDKKAALQILGKDNDWEDIWGHSESSLVVEFEGPHAVTISGMKDCLQTFGELRSFEQEDNCGKKFYADYWDTRHARAAVLGLHGQMIECSGKLKSSGYFTLGSAAYHIGSAITPRTQDRTPNRDVHDPFREFCGPPLLDHPDHTYTSSTLTSPSTSLSCHYQGAQSSPTFSEWHRDKPKRFAAVEKKASCHSLLERSLSSEMGVGRELIRLQKQRETDWGLNHKHAIPPENKVYPERILSGLDWRTTVMIKDVPNKLSRKELVDILNEVVPGGFDFVYLRFDFNNHCNVGYAFVNFTSVKDLYRFIQLRVGRKWNMFSSEKVLQYVWEQPITSHCLLAIHRGKTALINKFRNSSVMDVIEPWRPQIFYSSGALKGQPSNDLPQRLRSQSARLSEFSSSDYDYAGSVFKPSYGF